MSHCLFLLAGADVTPDTFGELEISGGRSDWLGDVEPASLSVSMQWPVWAPTPVLGDRVQVAGWLPHTGDRAGSNAALFDGAVTDVAVEGDIVSLVAVDPLRRLDGLMIGDEPWPAEPWQTRAPRIVEATARQLPAEDRPWFSEWVGWNGAPPTIEAGMVARRDVDRQDALQVLRDMMRDAGRCFWYVPDRNSINDAYPAPTDPQRWRPGVGYGTVMPRDYLFFAQVPAIPAAWIVADPPPRQAMNLQACVNLLKVSGPVVDATGRPLDGDGSEWQVLSGVGASQVSRYGPRSGTMPLRHALPGPGVTGGPWLDPWQVANAWLRRSGWPSWSADGVLVDFTQPDPGRPAWMMQRAWLWLAQGGAAKACQSVALHGVTGSTDGPAPADGAPNWVAEQRTIRWTENGWEVELTSLTDPAVYRGTVGPPIDPRTNVTLAVAPVQPVPTAGTLLQPLWASGGRVGAWGGVWRFVAPDLGVQGPTVTNRGPGTLLPTGPLPVGVHRVLVQHLASGDATHPTDWLELRLRVVAGYRWRDLDPALPWRQVPAELTWKTADTAADWKGN